MCPDSVLDLIVGQRVRVTSPSPHMRPYRGVEGTVVRWFRDGQLSDQGVFFVVAHGGLETAFEPAELGRVSASTLPH